MKLKREDITESLEILVDIVGGREVFRDNQNVWWDEFVYSNL